MKSLGIQKISVRGRLKLFYSLIIYPFKYSYLISKKKTIFESY